MGKEEKRPLLDYISGKLVELFGERLRREVSKIVGRIIFKFLLALFAFALFIVGLFHITDSFINLLSTSLPLWASSFIIGALVIMVALILGYLAVRKRL